MTQCDRTLDDLWATLDGDSRRLSLHALCSFVRGVPIGSMTFAAIYPERTEESVWSRGEMTEMLLAQVCDTLSLIDYHYMTAHSENPKSVQAPSPIERPGVTSSKHTRHFGREPIRVSDFEAWWNGDMSDAESGKEKTEYAEKAQ